MTVGSDSTSDDNGEEQCRDDTSDTVEDDHSCRIISNNTPRLSENDNTYPY